MENEAVPVRRYRRAERGVAKKLDAEYAGNGWIRTAKLPQMVCEEPSLGV